MNSWSGIGRLVRDPDIRYTSGDNPLCVSNFMIAVDRIGKGKGADFIPCTAFGKTAEIMERYCGKGKQIGVTGRITSDSYEDRDGNRRTKYFVTCERLDLLGGATTQESDKTRSERVYARSERSEEYDPREDFASLDSESVPF